MASKCRMYAARFPGVNRYVMAKLKRMTKSGDEYVCLLPEYNIEGFLSMSSVDVHLGPLKVGQMRPLKVILVHKEEEEEDRVHVDLTQLNLSVNAMAECENLFKKSNAVHSVMLGVAEATQNDLEDIYTLFGWPLYERYGHAFEAFRLIKHGNAEVLAQVPWLIRNDLRKVLKERMKEEVIRVGGRDYRATI